MRRIVAVTLGALTLMGASSAHAVPVPNPWPGLHIPCASRGLGNTAYVTGVNCRHILHQKYPRRFVTLVPPKAARKMGNGHRVPLVLMLHGSGGTGEQFLLHSGWSRKATREGFVVAFPTGITYLLNDGSGRHNTKWNSFSLLEDVDPTVVPPGWPHGSVFPADDVGFLRKLIANTRSKLRIDARRIYIAGFSNGGQMCSRAGIQMSDIVAAVACNAGFLHEEHHPVLPNPNMPTLLAIGNRDYHILDIAKRADPTLEEVPLDPATLDRVMSDTFSITLASLQLVDQPRRETVATNTTTIAWARPVIGNPFRNSLVFVGLDDVEHNYPNGKTLHNPHRFNMPDIAWPFFLANPR
jgi:poly(3-hydroxybutyrate) depolymerase